LTAGSPSGAPATHETEAAVYLTRTFPVPRERVFRAWTDPEQFRRWFGPTPGWTPSAEMDVRPGGSYRIEMKTSFVRTRFVVGTFLEVVPPERLVYTFDWEGPVPTIRLDESLVTVEFVDLGEATEVRILHERLPKRWQRAFHRWGWNGSLRRLTALLEPSGETNAS
jgi:uncharacterized protein YndB with AHSA1/START domain